MTLNITSALSIRDICAILVLLIIHVVHVNTFSTASARHEPRKLFGGYRITPRFCNATRTPIALGDDPRGPTICMFNHECTQRNGEVVGACMDGFLFGACCQLPTVESVPTATSLPIVMDISNSQDFAIVRPHNTKTSTSTERIRSPSTSSHQDSSLEYTYELPTLITSESVDKLNQDSHTEKLTELTSNGISQITNSLLGNQNANYPGYDPSIYTHSSISHSSAETILVHLNGSQVMDVARPSDFSGSTSYQTISSTMNSIANSNKWSEHSTRPTVNELIPKPVYVKPMFKPKPTKVTLSDADKYVLVHTISNESPVDASIKIPTIQKPLQDPISDSIKIQSESIESIIMMLNDTKIGPEYGSDSESDSKIPLYPSSHPTTRVPTDTTAYNAGSLNQSTTKLPSTSYIYSPSVTKRPGYEPSTHKYTNSFGSSLYSTTKLPSTSYIYSSNPTKFASSDIYSTSTEAYSTSKKPPSTSYISNVSPTKRPDSNTHNVVSTEKLPNLQLGYNPNPVPTVIVLGHISTEFSTNNLETQTESNMNIKVSQTFSITTNKDGSIKKPVSQVSINNVISTSADDLNRIGTEKPSPTVLITPKPTTNLVTSSSWTQKPTIIKRPTAVTNKISTGVTPETQLNNVQNVFLSTNKPPSTSYVYSPTFTIRPDYKPTRPTNYGSSSSENSIQFQELETTTTKTEYLTAPDDLINFPPVRNPNLNTSALHSTNYNTNSSVTFSDYDIDISTPSFMEDDNLDDKMNLFVSKIVESLQGNFQNLKDVLYENKTSTLTNNTKPTKVSLKPQRPITTRKPTTTSKFPVRRPSGTTKKPSPTTKAPVTSSKRPALTSKRPFNRITTPATTKRPITTRKPKPTTQKTKPAETIVITTTKKPTRISTTTKKTKPTKRTPSTVATTEYDEIIDEDQETTTISSTQSSEYKRQCGIRPLMKTGRIVGGKGATFGQWPWQVLVRESTWLGLFTKNKCGGVLITNRFVMTAAHCQPGFLASLVAVFGEFDISGELESKRSVTKNVKRVIVHRQYDAATFENDLALLELDSPVHYDSHIVPICMPSDGADFTGRLATVTGWGRLKYGGGVPSVLQEVQVPIMENSVCQEMFHTAGHSKTILSSFLCAGYANGQKDSCEGDSGGPLVLQRPDGRWELAGTVSHGIKCAAPYLPGVYMRTTYFKPWLQSVTGVH